MSCQISPLCSSIFCGCLICSRGVRNFERHFGRIVRVASAWQIVIVASSYTYFSNVSQHTYSSSLCHLTLLSILPWAWYVFSNIGCKTAYHSPSAPLANRTRHLSFSQPKEDTILYPDEEWNHSLARTSALLDISLCEWSREIPNKPSAVLSYLARTSTSLASHGENLSMEWSPDGKRIVIQVC